MEYAVITKKINSWSLFLIKSHFSCYLSKVLYFLAKTSILTQRLRLRHKTKLLHKLLKVPQKDRISCPLLLTFSEKVNAPQTNGETPDAYKWSQTIQICEFSHPLVSCLWHFDAH